MSLLPKITRGAVNTRDAELERDMIRREAKIGGTLFGKIPQGHNRQFFCLDETTWVWHEDWVDTSNKQQSVTIRYEVRPDGVLKIQNNHTYQTLGYDEAFNLYRAVEMYEQKVMPLYAVA
jgi:hypothetical protein